MVKHSEKKKSALRGGGIALGVLAFLVFQYGSAIWRLTHSAGGMDSKFSKVAVDDYLDFIVGQNAYALIAYGIIGLVAWVVLVPVLSPLLRGWWGKATWRIVLIAFGASCFVHGYFMFRLVSSRPYFTGDATFGSWYYRILEWPPESWRSAIDLVVFQLPIWAILVFAACWWFRRFSKMGRTVMMLVLTVAAGAAVLPRLVELFPQNHSMQSADGRPMNVIVIGSDSLRGDRLGYAGYRPPMGDVEAGVSPNIDAWAKDASVFEECRTPIGSTLESGIMVMTSSYPHSNGIRQMFPSKEQLEAMRERTVPLAELAKEKGYDTAAVGDWCAGYFELTPLGFEEINVSSFDSFQIYVSQAVLMAHFVVPLYFDNDFGHALFPQIRSFAQFVTPEVVTRRVEKMMRKQAATGRPFFWNVFYSCNHLPYRSTEPYNRLFSDPNYEGANATGVDFDIDAFIGGTTLGDKWAALPESEAMQIRALYDGCTRQFDDCFQRILEALEQNGLAENTVVVLTADHGDDLYEPGVTLGHGLGFQGADASYHVPLAIRLPQGEARRFAEQVRILDIAPTIAGLMGIKAPESWEGVDLGSWMLDPSKAETLPYYGETQFPFIQFRVEDVERPPLPPMDELTEIDPDFNHQFVMRPDYRKRVIEAKQRCLRTADWKLVCTPKKDGGRHFQLFHTASDPDCVENLIEVHPEVARSMKKALERWMDDHYETAVTEIFPQGEPARN